MFDPDYRGNLDVSDYESRGDLRVRLSNRDLQHLRALYDGEVRWTDSQIGACSRDCGRWDATTTPSSA